MPDEYFQSIELAHAVMFEYGEIVWEYKDHLRSGIWYGSFEAYFKALELTNLYSAFMVNDFPSIIIAVLFLFALQLPARQFKGYSWLIQFSWMHYFMGPRTLVNTLEYIAYTLALKTNYFYFFVVTSCVLRPTMAVFYIPFAARQIYGNPKSVIKWIIYAILGVFFSTAIDSLYYKQLTSSIYNFVQFNIVQNHSEFYGVHNTLWYVTSAIPTLLGPTTLYFILGLVYAPKSTLLNIFIPVCCFSLIKHKEFRFIYPIMDQLLIVAKHGAIKFPNVFFKRMVICLNIVFIVFFGFIHQRGVYDAMNFLRNESVDSLLILAPCYSFPGNAYFNSNVSIMSLRCDPPHYPSLYPNQDIFYSNPQLMTNELTKKYSTSHILKFDALNVTISGYKLHKSFFNSFFHDDERRQGRIQILIKVN